MTDNTLFCDDVATTTLASYAKRLAASLEAAERSGSERDYPEGACYVTLSDTLVKKIVSDLRELAEKETNA